MLRDFKRKIFKEHSVPDKIFFYFGWILFFTFNTDRLILIFFLSINYKKIKNTQNFE